MENPFRRMTKEKIRPFNLESKLHAVLNLLFENENKKQTVEDTILKYVNGNNLFDEEEVIKFLEKELSGDQEVLNKLVQEDNGKKTLKQSLKGILESYYRISPEKEGINFRDKLDTPELVRAYLYLVFPEDEKGPFKGDFERLLSQKEEFFFRLWPPKIGLKFRALLKGEFKGEFKPGEFNEEVRSYLEVLSKGKAQITLYFESLPDELKNKTEKELQKLGIFKKDKNYEIYLRREQMEEIFARFIETAFVISKEETEIGKTLKNVIDLFKETRGKLKKMPEGFAVLAGIEGLLGALKEKYETIAKEGGTENERKKLIESLDKLENFFNDINRGIERNDRNILKKAADWLKYNGKGILSLLGVSFGLWSLAIGLFIPMWIITEVYKKIEEKIK